MLKKISIPVIIIISIGAIFFYANRENYTGASVLRVYQGGTGAATFTAGECLVGNGTGAITTQACGGTSFSGTLNDISDVATTTTSWGDLLMWSGTAWTNKATSTLGISGVGSESDPVWLAASTSYFSLTTWYATTSHPSFASTTHTHTAYQALDATLTDIADGTIAENLVNTANPWADNEVADDITASNYLSLSVWFATTSAPQLTSLANVTDIGTIAKLDFTLASGTAITADNLYGNLTGNVTGTASGNLTGSSMTNTWFCNGTDNDKQITCATQGDATADCDSGQVCMGGHTHTVYQAADATLTDIADGTIAEDLVNTANPWADNEVADTITASNYLALTAFYSTTTHTIISSLPSLATVGTITSGIWNGTAVGVGYGGTGLTSVTAGYFLIGNSATVLQATSTIFITPTGSVGIGSSSPMAKFVVSSGGTATTTTQIGDSTLGTNVGKVCWWNGSNYTVEYYPANSTTKTVATSTTCN